MKPEVFHLVKLVKKYHPNWSKKSYKEVENAILWYALHAGLIHVTSENGEALVLARRLDDIGERIDSSTFSPNGKILWIELFYQTHWASALDLLRIGIERWNECEYLAFHRAIDNESPASYRIYDKKFVIRYLNNLRNKFKE